MTIEESAMLNTGKCGNWMKSTTCPRPNPGARNSRSRRFPTAPPSSRPRAAAHHQLPRRRTVRQDHRDHHHGDHGEQPRRPVAIEKAAPALRVK
jgi:hypothetical protein